MSGQTFIERLCFELYQDDTPSRLYQILNSKRLMKDHLDILEEISAEPDVVNATNFVRPSVALGLVATVTASSYWIQQIRSNKIAQSLAIVVPGFYLGLLVIKLTRRILNRYHKRTLDDLISKTQRIDNNLQKHVLFLNELRLLHTDELSIMARRTEQRQEKVIEFIRTATMRFYKSIQYLEQNSSITQSHYDPIESMDVEDAFENKQNNEPKVHLKQIYNLFLYMQSHFLLLLGEAVINCEQKKSLLPSIQQLVFDLNRGLNAVDHNLKFETIVRKPIQAKAVKTDNSHRQINDLKCSSSNLIVKLSAVAHKFVEIDQQFIQGHEKPDKIISSLQAIENSLELCNDELKRFMILYQKSMKIDVPQIDAPNNDDANANANPSKVTVTKIAHNDALPKEGDYFAVFDGSYDENQHTEEPQSSLYADLNVMDQKLVKRKFENVLSQLKGKIKPIEKSLVERERDFFLSQGLDVEKLLARFLEVANVSSDESEDDYTDSDDDIAVKPKITSQEKFDEMRQFLMTKTQMPMLQLPMTGGIMGEEEILE